MFTFVQRAAIALCLISLFSCSLSPCRQWQIQEVLAKYPCFNGGRLTLASDSDCSYLEVELIRNRSGIRFYINILFLQAQPLQDNPSHTRLEIVFEGQDPWVVYPYLMEGGQRLLLPGEIADPLIQALLDDCCFTIRMGRNQVNVISDNFSLLYQKFLAITIEEEV